MCNQFHPTQSNAPLKTFEVSLLATTLNLVTPRPVSNYQQSLQSLFPTSSHCAWKVVCPVPAQTSAGPASSRYLIGRILSVHCSRLRSHWQSQWHPMRLDTSNHQNLVTALPFESKLIAAGWTCKSAFERSAMFWQNWLCRFLFHLGFRSLFFNWSRLCGFK